MGQISVIVPIYNVEAYLSRCVDSLLAQTYEDFELILVDDGSPDGCPGICDAYAEMDARVRVIHKENGGLSDARNAGLRAAQGAYIAFVDSDDWVDAHYLEHMLLAMNETDSDICECGVVKVFGDGEQGAGQTGERTIYPTQEALEALICDDALRQHVWNKLYKRTCLDGIDFAVGKTNEDEFFTYQVFGRARRVVKICDVLYMYFQRPGSIMGSGYSIRRLDALEAKEMRQAYIEQHFPSLEGLACSNLLGSCIYAGQMTLRHLQGEEQRTARGRIDEIIRRHDWKKALASAKGKARIWTALACMRFWWVCRLRNGLNVGF